MLKGSDKSYYIENAVGLYFFFTACAGVSIVVWVFNWVCWANQCCCCDFLHNPVNKRIAWWMSFTFLLGILACCISGCVSVNRFGFSLEGAWCAIDRIYYDTTNGELVGDPTDILFEKEDRIDENGDTFNIAYNSAINDIKKNFEEQNFKKYAKVAKACLKILAMIYFCLLIIVVSFSGVSLMFFACLKRQGYLITFMHILWNIIRFFMFSFFFYGTAYGIGYHFLRDSIALTEYIFKENNEEFIVPKFNLIKYCFTFQEKKDLKETQKYFCKIIRRDVNLLYWALNDASKESQNLSAISLCISFFGAVAVYFFLLVMHHYNNELFFDSGKSIFKGFDGFGGGYRKKNIYQDPAYKKRKIRAEIEMTSNNEQISNNKDVNKNGNDNEDNF